MRRDDPEPSPATQLALSLRELRSQGLAFEQAWSIAWPRVNWSLGRTERKLEKQAIEWAREFFRDAYDNPQTMPAWIAGFVESDLVAA